MNAVEAVPHSSSEMSHLVVLSFGILFLTLAVAIQFDIKREMEYETFKRRYDICHLPVQQGKCTHRVKSWYYNPVKQMCERFIYTLCGGNANRFYTEEECMEFCNVYRYEFKVW